jgi:hypothetical protein
MRTSLFLVLALLSGALVAEPARTRTLVVLPTTDTTDLGLAKPLQNALAILSQDSGLFTTKLSEEALPGFTKSDIAAAFNRINSELLTFVYMEIGRVSIFLFDSTRAGEFVLAFEMLTPPGENLTNSYVEEKFRSAWNSVIAQYMAGTYQPLPGAAPNEKLMAQTEEQHYKALEAKRLFRELASLEEHNYYAGANIGMVRFSAEGTSASTVNFGGLVGTKLSRHFYSELGFDIFSYFVPHVDLRYTLPLEERHVFLSTSLSIATIMGEVTQNRGASSTTLKNGDLLYGPGFSFDIPLLGVNLRGDLRLYFGKATVFLGTYGIVYAL